MKEAVKLHMICISSDNDKHLLYFRTVHVVILILFKPTHAPFLKHIHIHI